jgi:hypothetical protein
MYRSDLVPSSCLFLQRGSEPDEITESSGKITPKNPLFTIATFLSAFLHPVCYPAWPTTPCASTHRFQDEPARMGTTISVPCALPPRVYPNVSFFVWASQCC